MTVQELLQHLGNRVRHLRKARQWSIRELAEQSGVSPRFLTSLEAGQGNISVARLYQVAMALNEPLHGFFQEPETGDAGWIALVGLRGAGKTTIGQHLAKRLCVPFIELDTRIEDEAGMSLGEVFSLHGEEYYRRLERETLARVLRDEPSGILATGGGIVSAPDSLALLRSHCATVWLRATPGEHMERVLQQGDQRPVRGRANAMAELRTLLRSREHLYRQAQLHVSTSGKTIPDTVEEVARGLGFDTV